MLRNRALVRATLRMRIIRRVHFLLLNSRPNRSGLKLGDLCMFSGWCACDRLHRNSRSCIAMRHNWVRFVISREARCSSIRTGEAKVFERFLLLLTTECAARLVQRSRNVEGTLEVVRSGKFKGGAARREYALGPAGETDLEFSYESETVSRAWSSFPLRPITYSSYPDPLGPPCPRVGSWGSFAFPSRRRRWRG